MLNGQLIGLLHAKSASREFAFRFYILCLQTYFLLVVNVHT